jgi:putative ABC transport system permease protein
LEEDNPASNSDMTVDLAPLKEDIIGETGKPLKLLLWAVCFVLLIACVNVMNLVLVRTLSRQREFAVCSAFGASRSRTLRQFLAEGLVLALLSGGLGVLLASWVVKLFVGFGPEGIPRLEEVGVDARAIGFALIVALLVGVALGLFPALSTQGESLSEALRVGSRGTEGIRRRRARAALVVVEVGLAVVLLICVGLMTVSFVHLFRTDAGFQPQNILTLRVTLSPSVYPTPEQQASFYEQLLGRIGTLPGVEGAAMVNHLPLAGEDTDWTFTVEGRQVQRGQEPKAGYRVVEADYFRTMKIPLVYGRGFQPFDHRQGTTAVIVNQTMARLSWPAESPLGKRFRLGNVDSDQPWLTVVGVVGDVRHTGLAIPARPELFLPFSPDWWDSMALVVRTGGDPAQWVGPVRSAIRELDKNLPIDDVETMEHVLASPCGSSASTSC